MKLKYLIIPLLAVAVTYAFTTKFSAPKPNITGTWKLLSGTEISNGAKTVTDYTKDQQMIKIINDTHFAFLKHWLATPKDSFNNFDAGGRPYTLVGNNYTEHLDYYSKKNIEGSALTFTVNVVKDMLIQQSVEKLKDCSAQKIIYENICG